ncbi:uncharacterized protein LOC129583364 [Paramacrobiotus metropolitanus]|uniref:uncharacterized protein LOC129583364 n=1 Tax=Paramacrobiotus metropolitanus TaxID=2943436 RepID=UPI0024460197|nr:uncharacterized protein LOC129583364 [Paramacrobiotus metropolitanus]
MRTPISYRELALQLADHRLTILYDFYTAVLQCICECITMCDVLFDLEMNLAVLSRKIARERQPNALRQLQPKPAPVGAKTSPRPQSSLPEEKVKVPSRTVPKKPLTIRITPPDEDDREVTDLMQRDASSATLNLRPSSTLAIPCTPRPLTPILKAPSPSFREIPTVDTDEDDEKALHQDHLKKKVSFPSELHRYRKPSHTAETEERQTNRNSIRIATRNPFILGGYRHRAGSVPPTMDRAGSEPVTSQRSNSIDDSHIGQTGRNENRFLGGIKRVFRDHKQHSVPGPGAKTPH